MPLSVTCPCLNDRDAICLDIFFFFFFFRFCIYFMRIHTLNFLQYRYLQFKHVKTRQLAESNYNHAAEEVTYKFAR